MSPRPRSRQRKSPSSALLSFLATVATSSTSSVASPLTFLYPTLDDHVAEASQGRNHFDNVDVQVFHHLNLFNYVHRDIPDKYLPGEDGVWRRVESYTLYGSTVCKNCADATSTSDSPLASTAQIDSSPDGDLMLPKGWGSTTARSSRTVLVITLSLSLSFFMGLFILSCLFWRKKSRRKRDVEMKGARRKYSSREDDEMTIIEMETKRRTRIWAKASARWRANVRQSARQRRGRRLNSPRTASSSQTHFDRPSSPALSIPSNASPFQSPVNSRRNSLSRRSSVEEHRTSANPDHASVPDTLSSEPPPIQHYSPPAYHRELRETSLRPSSPNFPDQPDAYPSLSPHRRASTSSSRPVCGYDMPLYSTSCVHTAHVATDDKAVLEQLSKSASAPPSSNEQADSSGSEMHLSSAPVWQDERLEDFEDVEDNLSHDGSCHGMLPPPPTLPFSKGKGAEAYPYSYEESLISSLWPSPGPSAPPFEEGYLSSQPLEVASAPPLEDVELDVVALPEPSEESSDAGCYFLTASMSASAPPLDEVDVSYGREDDIDSSAAPPWDSASPPVQAQNHDRLEHD